MTSLGQSSGPMMVWIDSCKLATGALREAMAARPSA
jgi:hypothetical protein